MAESDDSAEGIPRQYDIFISYAHADDIKLLDEPHGWVEQFENEFRKTLWEQLGRPPQIWRDSDITPNDDFERKIFHRLAISVIFLPVLSKNFVNSNYCKRELRTFVENAEKQGKTYIGAQAEKTRIFIVEKLPVQPLPAEFQGLGGRFKFHDSDNPLRPTLSAKDSPIRDMYVTALNRLSRTAAKLIELASADKQSENEQPAGVPIYLAETTPELFDARESLRDELDDRGFRVLPELELPRGSLDEYTKAVKDCLDEAALSIHLFGRKYGASFDADREHSDVELQHALALKREPPLPRVLWLANGSDTASSDDDARQREFLDALQNDEKVHVNAELLVGDLQSMKTDLLEKLAKLKASAQVQTPEHPRVYIICDKADRSSEHLKALRKHLFDQGCESRLPTEDGTDEEMRKAHEQKLQGFDAFIIYAGAGNGAWLEAQLDDYHSFLSNRVKKVFAKAVYVVPPPTSAKDELETSYAADMLLHGGDAFSAETVAPFLRLCGKSAVKGR
jgi:TIR domain